MDVGRFTTVDPVYTWQENLEDPQRWNRYAYVRNNPLRYVDPDGRDTRVTLYFGRDGNRFGHIGVGVNGASTYGLDPVGPASAVLRGDTVEGSVQLDTNEVKNTVVIPTTAAEDKAASRSLQLLRNRTNSTTSTPATAPTSFVRRWEPPASRPPT